MENVVVRNILKSLEYQIEKSDQEYGTPKFSQSEATFNIGVKLDTVKHKLVQFERGEISAIAYIRHLYELADLVIAAIRSMPR